MTRLLLLASLVVISTAPVTFAQYNPNYYNPYNRGSGLTSGGFYTGNIGISIGVMTPFGPRYSYIPAGPITGAYSTPFGTVAVGGSSLQPRVFSQNGYRNYDPYGGFIRGSTSSRRNSNYSPNSQSDLISKLDREPQEDRNQPEGPRLIWDDWKRNQNQAAIQEDFRETAVVRALDQPNMSEILSGDSLNTLLKAIEGKMKAIEQTRPMPIEEALLKQLNFSKGMNHGNFGLLKDQGKIYWPKGLSTLDDAALSTLREEAEKQLTAAYEQATKGKVDAEKIKSLESISRRLQEVISSNVGKLGFEQHREAKRFVKSFDDTIAFLAQPDVHNWMPGKHAFENKTVQDMVKCMAEKGLRFAPAVQGSENAYLAIHQALAQLYVASTQVKK